MTNSDFELSIIAKMTLLKFLMTCFVPLMRNTSSSDWFQDHGLMEEITFIVIFMNVGEAIRIVFHWEYVMKVILRYYFAKQKENCELTQRQINGLFENDPAVMSKTLSVILVFIFTILFFSPLVPGLTIFGIVGSLGMYWVLKFLIIRRKSIKRNISASLIMRVSGVLKFGVLANSICGFFFFSSLLNHGSMPLLLNFIIGILFFVLPIQTSLIKYFNKQGQKANENEEDDEDYDKFAKDLKHYDLQNPITRALAISRLKGHSLMNSIRKAILLKLKNKVQAKGAYEIEDAQDDNLGVGGLQALILMKKQHNNSAIKNNLLSPIPIRKPIKSTAIPTNARLGFGVNNKKVLKHATIREVDSDSESNESNESNSRSNRI